MDSQQMTFTARRNNLNSDVKSIQESINALEEQIRGSRVQLDAVHRQIVLLDEEIVTKDEAGAGRAGAQAGTDGAAAVEGQSGRRGRPHHRATSAMPGTYRPRARGRSIGVRKTAIKTAVEQMHEVRGELADVRERMLSAKGILDRVRVTAPVSGVVVKLRYHTRGGVVEAGKNIMELLPLKDELIIEARLRPQDIDSVKARTDGDGAADGAEPAHHADGLRRTSSICRPTRWRMKEVPAGRTDRHLCRACVKLNGDESRNVPGFSPTPGMPAEVYIKTAERTFFQYIVRPIHDSMMRAFRER